MSPSQNAKRHPRPQRGESTEKSTETGSLVYRIARRLEGYSFSMVPEFMGVAEGLRAAFAVACALSVAMWFHSDVLLWSAFGAFWTCLCDPGGRDRARIRVMGSFVAFGTVSAFLGAASAGISPWCAAVLLVPLIFLPALGGALGSGGVAAGGLICVVGGVSVGFPNSATGALNLAGSFLAGGLWAVLLTFAIWRIRPQGPARKALGSVFARLRAMDLALIDRIGSGEGLGAVEPEFRRSQRTSLTRARGLILGLDNEQQKLQAVLDIADRIFAQLIALDHALSQPFEAKNRVEIRALLIRLAMVLQEAELQVTARAPAPAALTHEADKLFSEAKAFGGVVGRLVGHIAQTVGQLGAPLQPTPTVLMPSAGQKSARNWPKIPDAIWRHAFRLTVAVVVTYGICELLHLRYLFWATMATIVVLQPSLSTTWPRMLERVIGSMFGGACAAGVIAMTPTHGGLLAVIIPLAAATIALKRVNYAIFTACVGALFVLVIELMLPADGIAFARAVTNALGSVVALAAGLLLWPGKGEPRFSDTLAEAVMANMAYAVAAVRAGDLDAKVDELRKQAGVASTTAEVARQRSLLEGRRKSARLDPAGQVLNALRVLAGATTVHALSENAPDRQTADDITQKAQALSLSFKSGSVGALPAGTGDAQQNDLKQALTRVVITTQDYVRG